MLLFRESSDAGKACLQAVGCVASSGHHGHLHNKQQPFCFQTRRRSMLVTMMNSQERSGPPEALNQAPSSLGLQGHDVVAKKRAGASEKEDARAEANNESEEHEDKQFDPDDDVALTFPQRLMEILDDEQNSDIISWLPHGRGFVIFRRKGMEQKILPKYFGKSSKYSSFTRKLNRWGFTRVTRGAETGAYYHQFFRKGGYRLLMQMSCQSTNKGASNVKTLPPPGNDLSGMVINPVAGSLFPGGLQSMASEHAVLRQQQQQLMQLQLQQQILQQEMMRRALSAQPQQASPQQQQESIFAQLLLAQQGGFAGLSGLSGQLGGQGLAGLGGRGNSAQQRPGDGGSGTNWNPKPQD